MASQKITDKEFIELWEKLGSPLLVSQKSGVSIRQVMARRRNIEVKFGIALNATNSLKDKSKEAITAMHDGWTRHEIKNGTVVVFSDAHFWPDDYSTAFRALITFTKQFHPEMIVCNGDAFSGEQISRWARIGWDNKPTVKQELEAVKQHLDEIEAVSKGKLIWTLGNHDARFETFLAANAPQYEGVDGFTLKDHFPRWIPAWSCAINDDVVIKHRFKGGIHATHNNTIWSGKTIVTGHLHSLKVTPFTDYNGTRWGVDTGCLADVSHKQFLGYTENNPLNWRSGFVVLTFKDGQLLPPEIVQVWDDDSVTFRGAVIKC